MKIGVAKERAPNERRVALVPDVLSKLTAAGAEVLVERGAGDGAAFPDGATRTRRPPGRGATTSCSRRRTSCCRPAAAADDVWPGCARARPWSGCCSRSSTRRRRWPELAKARRHGDQPRRAAADAVARPVDGRAVVAGERRRLPGGPHRGRGVRPLLPAADDRRRHGPAGQRARPGHRRRRSAGDRHGARASGRAGQGLRRPLRDQGAGRVARRAVPRPEVGRRRRRARRLRARADAERSARRSRPSSTTTSAGMDVVITTAQVPGRRPAGPRDGRAVRRR